LYWKAFFMIIDVTRESSIIHAEGATDQASMANMDDLIRPASVDPRRYSKTREDVSCSVLCRVAAPRWSRRFECNGFEIQHLWFWCRDQAGGVGWDTPSGHRWSR
jgi:hypothetical protein